MDYYQTDHDLALPDLDKPPEVPSMSRNGYYNMNATEGNNISYNNFYQRLASQSFSQTHKVFMPHRVGQSYSTHRYKDPGPPVNKAGRLGAPWRHIRQTTGYGGNHICFVDGIVKQHDLKTFPPFGLPPRTEDFTYLPPPSPMPSAESVHSRSLANSGYSKKTSYNKNAKLGFKYWYDDRKAVPSSARPMMKPAKTSTRTIYLITKNSREPTPCLPQLAG